MPNCKRENDFRTKLLRLSIEKKNYSARLQSFSFPSKTMNDFSFLRNFKIENISHFLSDFIFILIMSSSGKQKLMTNVLYYVENQRKYLLGKETGNKNVLVSFDYVHTFKNSCKKALTLNSNPAPSQTPTPTPSPSTNTKLEPYRN